MKKSVVVLATIMFLGLVAADVAVLQPMTAYAAQTSGDQAEQPDDNAKNGQQGGGHLGHH